MPMPYSLAKGTILSVLEDLLNPDPNDLTGLASALTDLRNGVDLVDIGLVDSTNIVTPPNADPLEDRLQEYWFGKTELQGGGWAPQPAFSPAHPTTGYWRGYHGDVEGVLRETLIRAIEVSFGLDHGDDLVNPPPHQWPVEVFWKCPNPWFEGWVTWRDIGGTSQVTVIIATPADTSNRFVTAPALPPGATVPLPEPTAAPSGDQGMWVVSEVNHIPAPTVTFVGMPHGVWQIPLPTTTWVGVDPVRVVPVPLDWGGASAGGVPYVHP